MRPSALEYIHLKDVPIHALMQGMEKIVLAPLQILVYQ